MMHMWSYYHMIYRQPIGRAILLSKHNYRRLFCSSATKMQRPKIFVVPRDVPHEAIDVLRQHADVIVNSEPHTTQDNVVEQIGGVDGVLWLPQIPLNAAIINAAGPQLKVISTMSVGYDSVDVELLKDRGIKFGNTLGVLVGDTVSNSAIMLALAASRRLIEGYNIMRESQWSIGPQWFLGKDLSNATIGIVGLGNIGYTIARKLRAFNVGQILYSGHKEKPNAKTINAEFVSFDTLLANSQYVFVAAPLTNETRGLFDKTAFDKMRNDSIFINIARGAIVVQDDLVDALKNGQIFAAGLDVTTPEPLPVDHPLLFTPNCVITPHTGSATYATRLAMANVAVQNLLNFFDGKPMLSPVLE